MASVVSTAAQPRPIEQFDHVISLGTVCYSSWTIKGLGLKQASYPFDWIFSSPAMALDMLRDDFRRFLEPSYHRANPIEARPDPATHIAEHSFYRDRFGVAHVFSHRDVTEPHHLAYYQRCVARFQEVVRSSDRKLFVMINPGDRLASETDFAALCEWLDRHSEWSKLLVVNLRRSHGKTGLFNVQSMGRHELIEHYTRSAIRGLDFVNPADDQTLAELLRRYEVRLIPGPAKAANPSLA